MMNFLVFQYLQFFCHNSDDLGNSYAKLHSPSKNIHCSKPLKWKPYKAVTHCTLLAFVLILSSTMTESSSMSYSVDSYIVDYRCSFRT